MPDDHAGACRNHRARGRLGTYRVTLVVGRNDANRLAVGASPAGPDVSDGQFYAGSDRCGGIAWRLSGSHSSNDEICATYICSCDSKPNEE